MSRKRKQNKSTKNASKKSSTLESSISSGSVIKGIYTHKVKSLDGKKPDKRTCIYYDKTDKSCKNKRCSKSICVTSVGCTGYKRKEKTIANNKKKNLKYSDLYLDMPIQSGIHESTTESIKLSRDIGTPVHLSYLKKNDDRRHKARCIYIDNATKMCKWFMRKCTSSSRCDKYKER